MCLAEMGYTQGSFLFPSVYQPAEIPIQAARGDGLNRVIEETEFLTDGRAESREHVRLTDRTWTGER